MVGEAEKERVGGFKGLMRDKGREGDLGHSDPHALLEEDTSLTLTTLTVVLPQGS